MNPLAVEFDELYRRHLRRHSQRGINWLHLIVVLGIYLALLILVRYLPRPLVIIACGSVIYLIILLINVPTRVWICSAATVAMLAWASIYLPLIPWWLIVLVIVALHRFQVWQHRVFHRSLDMSEFASKYRKGPVLAALLAVYELPLLLNYVLFEGAVVEPMVAASNSDV